MGIRVALHHVTEYRYDRPVVMGPQVVRLRPAPHCRTPIESYSLRIEPQQLFLNWQQDPHGNFLARLAFTGRTRLFRVTVDLIADMVVINPFDFFIDEAAERIPWSYDPELARDLQPYLEKQSPGLLFLDYARSVDVTPRKTVDFLVDLNRRLQRDIRYLIRLEPGVQTCEETLHNRSGSCRDTAWLQVQLLRHFGLAARFVSGYLIQLAPDQKPLEGPEGPPRDFTDLHAWVEVFVPGAGWIGLDATSGLLAGEGHIPLAATPLPQTAAPISGAHEECQVTFHFDMHVDRVREDPRVTKPYTEEQWQAIDNLGQQVDECLKRNDVRLTMGGEPTFVSIDDMEGAEWTVAAVGPAKRHLSALLIQRLRARFAPGALLHFGQGKWYPGESLPRWAFTCLWRKDGEPVWKNPRLLGALGDASAVDVDQAGEFLVALVERLGVDARCIHPAYEDVWETVRQERKLPVDVDPRDFDADDAEERRRLASIIERGVNRPAGYVLPLTRAWWQAGPRWTSSPWPLRSDRLFLIPGDSPIGLRLPLEELPSFGAAEADVYPLDPFSPRGPLPAYLEIRRLAGAATMGDSAEVTISQQRRPDRPPDSRLHSADLETARTIVRTALCVEPRNGQLHVFMPPVSTLEEYLEILTLVEDTAETLQQPVIIEGYLPPTDHRIQMMKVTPDPGVIEVNVHPAASWTELREITTGVYEEARISRLGTEKFQLDGKHTGTGGGNHVVLGGPTPEDSPFLRRPDLLRSLLAYWNNHPSLSYLFSSQFIGPTSQSPRIDEGRRDALYELEIAFRQVPEQRRTPPWLVDRVFRHLLTDITGNTHRAEFCIDKLFSPDHASGRLGLVELRAFEMPPHSRMSLAQQLLVRSLVAWFWEQPYRQPLIRWGTAIHDRFLLPHYLWSDFEDVLRDLNAAEFGFRREWFAPHLEFRCPLVGEVAGSGIELELRTALEPWYVLGEEPGSSGTTRYVDSSVERLQVKVHGLTSPRYTIACNGRRLPLQATGTPGEFVAGVRYRAWQPPNCLHPTIGVHTPLVFDLVDLWQGRSVAGCKYHVDHPGGLNPSVYPINALEAESRRAARFTTIGHTPGPLTLRDETPLPEFPCTLDLRQ